MTGIRLSYYAPNHLQDDWAGQGLADAARRRREAEAEAAWYFEEATRRQQATFEATIRAMIEADGGDADCRREHARAQWREATQRARALFDETVACLLATGEVSEELDAKWTALCAANIAVAAE